MKCYLVGGAVRDKLLGRDVVERDWVVVGAEPAALVALGYRPVGKDFPVFLHPATAEEYALARTERKVAPGYHGFEFHADPAVTLEQDLARRDLTINAMAEDAEGRLIDPYGGRVDLEQRLLRHVSPAFAEDPVRVLRVARFAARFSNLGFRVAPETLELMRKMVQRGELSALVAERVWQEWQRALMEAHPSVFFATLRDCSALRIILPEIDRLFGVPQPAQHHPEIDTGVHTLMVVDVAARLAGDAAICFAAALHDVGKGTTPASEWPRHVGHEERGIALIEALCARLRVPRLYRDLAILVARYHGVCHRAFELRPSTVLALIKQLDGIRRPDRFHQVLLACEADARGRSSYEERSYPQGALLRRARDAAAAVKITGVVDAVEIQLALQRSRLAAVTAALREADREKPADAENASVK